MRIVLDTNVLVSGVFFTGPPHEILQAWRDGQLQLVYSPAMLEQYERVLTEIGTRLESTGSRRILQFLNAYGESVNDMVLGLGLCRDADDEKFIECYFSATADWIVSGDRDLLDLVDERVRVLSPRAFRDRFLAGRK